ncbi:MAG: tyrosine-type recombinase/integrase [Armatimonadota bacterium]
MAVEVIERKLSSSSDAANRTIALRRLQRCSERLLGAVVGHYLSAMEADPDLAGTSKVAYRTDVTQFAAFMGELGVSLLDEVELADLEAWRESMTHLKPNTVCRKFAAVSEFFSWARRHELISANPMELLNRPRKRHKEAPVVSLEDFERLFAVCETPTERGVLGLLFWAGLRRMEAANLTVGSVDIDNRMLHVMGKGGHERDVPICWNLVPILEEVLRVRGTGNADEPLFGNQWGNPLTPANVNRWFNRWTKRAGLQARNYTPHSCRHGLGTLLGAEGVSSLSIAAILGHQDPKTTQGYVHSSPEQLKRQLEQIEVFGTAPERESTPEDLESLKVLIAELTSEVRQLREEKG